MGINMGDKLTASILNTINNAYGKDYHNDTRMYDQRRMVASYTGDFREAERNYDAPNNYGPNYNQLGPYGYGQYKGEIISYSVGGGSETRNALFKMENGDWVRKRVSPWTWRIFAQNGQLQAQVGHYLYFTSANKIVDINFGGWTWIYLETGHPIETLYVNRARVTANSGATNTQ